MSLGFSGEKPVVRFGKSRTKQSYKDAADINKILAKYRKTGMVEHLSNRKPFYGDVSGIKSYQESLRVVQTAEDLFMSMSSDVRSRFANDPARMVAFLNDPRNIDEAVKLGMAVRRPVELKAPEVPEPKAKGKKPPKEAVDED